VQNNKIYNISILLPNPVNDAYWKPAVLGIQKAAEEYRPFGVSILEYYYNPTDRLSFLEKSKELLSLKPDFLLMAPLFQNEAVEIFRECQKEKILVSVFNNVIEAFNTETFVGQDLYQTGQVAAGLIDKLVKTKSAIAVLHIDEEKHMKLKENGFKDYFKLKENSPNIKTFSLKTTNNALCPKESLELTKTKDGISAIFVTNSKAYTFLETIGSLGDDVIIIGYDLLDKNVEFLKQGKIDFLIHQKPKRQAYLSVGYIAEHFLFGKPIPSQKLLPIGIITPENVSGYLR